MTSNKVMKPALVFTTRDGTIPQANHQAFWAQSSLPAFRPPHENRIEEHCLPEASVKAEDYGSDQEEACTQEEVTKLCKKQGPAI